MTQLQKEIKERGIKQKFIAQKLNISESYTSMLINGRKNNAEMQQRIMRLLKRQ